MTISERIFKIMKDKGITQLEFSRLTGIAQSTISDWKRKKTNPAADKILVICDALKISPNELLQDHVPDKSVDYVIVSKNTEAYKLLVEYEKLDRSSKDRLLGYISALCD
ncbi:MAG: helix-turn-helix transcriptional regulator [Clostridiales bacterium]|nr:helix-turn-helix transcriptional regulator [Clostridiales bacterium]